MRIDIGVFAKTADHGKDKAIVTDVLRVGGGSVKNVVNGMVETMAIGFVANVMN